MIKNYLTILILFLLSLGVYGQQLTYKPISPFFGGDTFNYQQILASAAAQNKFKEEIDTDFKQKTELEEFTDSLNRQLLNALSRDLFQQEFGETSFTIGTYVFGSLVVDISPTINGLLINVLDTSTGDQTQITIPNA
ncbi:MAG: curli assembly protein CsgF [Flavobacteriaceae bacterium]|nr:MAG: curli assembly protein CsgF [Flavobacteriaceae bacterium]